MTWDVYALRAPGARSVEQLPDGYSGPALGTHDDVVETIRSVVPHVDASDPRWLRIEALDHQIEVALGKGVRVHDVTFFISGGDGSAKVVLDVCRALAITPFDTETGEVLTADSRAPVAVPAAVVDDDERPWWRRLLGG